MNKKLKRKPSIKDLEILYRFGPVDCEGILNGDDFSLQYGLEMAEHMYGTVQDYALTPDFYIRGTQNCPRFVRSRGYITQHLTQLERDFPIAYSILAFRDIEMLERLLRMIYRPQNPICVHIDKDVDKDYFQAVQGIVGCFNNVFLAPVRHRVVWGTFSVLRPELTCMRALWERNKKWKYFINLTGQEFPLKTNFELVKILTAYRGANDVEGTVQR